MAMLAKALWHGPAWFRFPLAMFGWAPVQDAWVDAPHTYRFMWWEPERIDAHDGSWNHRWSTLTRKHAV